MTRTAIAAVVLRRPAVLVGRVVAVRAYVRPWVRLHVELSDGTEIAGLAPGVRLRVEGIPSIENETIIMLNPHYVFVPDEAQSE